MDKYKFKRYCKNFEIINNNYDDNCNCENENLDIYIYLFIIVGSLVVFLNR